MTIFIEERLEMKDLSFFFLDYSLLKSEKLDIESLLNSKTKFIKDLKTGKYIFVISTSFVVKYFLFRS